MSKIFSGQEMGAGAGIMRPGDGGEFLFGIPGKKGPQSPCSSQRVFKLFKPPIIMKIPGFEDYKLVPVSKIDWPKARIWAQQLRWKPTPGHICHYAISQADVLDP